MAKNNEKISAARSLYLTGNYNQAEIARMLGISDASITKAKKEEGWEEEIVMQQKIEESSESIIRELVHYNLMILRGRARKGMKSLEDGETTDASDLTLISGKETDGLSKLFAQIKRKDLAFSDTVNIITNLLDFIARKDKSLAEQVTAYTDEYIQDLTKRNK